MGEERQKPLTAEERNYKIRTFQPVPDDSKIDSVQPAEWGLGGISASHEVQTDGFFGSIGHDPRIRKMGEKIDKDLETVNEAFKAEQMKRRKEIH